MKKILLFGLVFFVVLAIPISAYPNEKFESCHNITVNSNLISGNLTDFPLSVKLNSTYINYTVSDQKYIRFYNDSCQNTSYSLELDYGIELWNESGDSWAWVKVDNLYSNVDRNISILYENTSAVSDTNNITSVFNNSYVAVFLLNETSGNGTDVSPSNLNVEHTDLTWTENVIIDGGAFFDNVNDRMELQDQAPINFDSNDNFTVCFWFSTNTTDNDYLINKRLISLTGWYMDINGAVLGKLQYVQYPSGSSQILRSATNNLNNSGYHYVCFGRDGTTGRLFLNESQDNSTTISAGNITGDDLEIGGLSEGGYSFGGYMDTLTISNIWRGTDWISTDFYSQNDQLISAFGTAESPPPAVPPFRSPRENTVWSLIVFLLIFGFGIILIMGIVSIFSKYY